MEILRWANIAPGASFHAARNTISFTPRLTYHGHDFAEIFWIDAGHGLHRVNRSSVPLRPGSLVLIRPSDCHGFEPAAGLELKMTNIAFPREILTFLHRRYFAKHLSPFSEKEKLPAMRQIEPVRLRRFNRWADELSASPREPLHLERFLLNLLVELDCDSGAALPDGAPEWLTRACAAVQRPEHFSRGVEQFLRLCGRSREHVARTVRRHLNRTPTEYVNGIRMAYAQRQLEMGDQGILEIALDCGIQNLSHFYSLFRARTGTTPRNYRRAHGKPLA